MLLFLSMKTSVAEPSSSCFCSVVVCGYQTAAQTLTWMVWTFCQRMLAVTRRKSPFCFALWVPLSLVPHVSPVRPCCGLATPGRRHRKTGKGFVPCRTGEESTAMEEDMYPEIAHCYRPVGRRDPSRPRKWWQWSANRSEGLNVDRKWKAKTMKRFHPVFV
jgi:hypothetical protein